MSLGTLALIGICGLCGPLLSAGARGAIPAVVGEILAGVVVGDTGVRLVDTSNPTLTFLADIGFAMLMFNAGMHVPLHDERVRASLGRGALGCRRGRGPCRGSGPAGLEDRSDRPPRGIRGADRFGVSRGCSPGDPGAPAAWRSRADRDRSGRRSPVSRCSTFGALRSGAVVGVTMRWTNEIAGLVEPAGVDGGWRLPWPARRPRSTCSRRGSRASHRAPDCWRAPNSGSPRPSSPSG